MYKSQFIEEFYQNFGHLPTEHQAILINKLVDFVASQEKNQLFLLKGYAGTGKTSILGSLVKTLVQNKSL